MKSLAELKAIKDKMQSTVTTRDVNDNSIRIIVGMGTCGIASGARKILNNFSEEVIKCNLTNVVISQTGCIGFCQYEPMAEVFVGDTKTTYVNLTDEKVKRIVAEHLICHTPIDEFAIGAVK